jgi:hypothetical protein
MYLFWPLYGSSGSLVSVQIPFIDADSEFLFNRKYEVGPASTIHNPPGSLDSKDTKPVSDKDPSISEQWDRCNFMEKLEADEIYREVGLHVARTLDQSYYDENTDERTKKSIGKGTKKGNVDGSADQSMGNGEDQQVVTRYISNEIDREIRDSKKGAKKDAIEIPILVVKQLWLWTVNKSTCLQFLH